MDGYFLFYVAAFRCGILFGMCLMARMAIYAWNDPDFAEEKTSDESARDD